MAEGRLSQAEQGSQAGIVINIAVAILKGVAAVFSGSFALLADALHSFLDSISSFAIWSGIRAANTPTDRKHLYRHGKRESAAAIIVAVVLFIVGIELLRRAEEVLYYGVAPKPQWYAFAAIFVSMLVKEGLYRYRARQRTHIPSKLWVAYNVERRIDIWTSIIILVCMGAALIGHVFGLSWLRFFDPIAGTLIAFLLIWRGYQFVVKGIQAAWNHELMDADAVPLTKTVQSVNGVILIKELRAMEYGHYVIVEVTISVNPSLSVAEGYVVAQRVKDSLMHRFLHVADVNVNVHPLERDQRKFVDLEGSSSHWLQ